MLDLRVAGESNIGFGLHGIGTRQNNLKQRNVHAKPFRVVTVSRLLLEIRQRLAPNLKISLSL